MNERDFSTESRFSPLNAIYRFVNIYSSCLPVSCITNIEINSSVINIPPTVKLISQGFRRSEERSGDR